MKHPLFSIITVCYNAEDLIESTIKSVLSQTNKDYEYIIVDGASQDRTLEILSKYKKHIDHLVSEPDEGIYYAMNKGAKLARGKYVYYLNAGDWLNNPYVLENVALVLKKELSINILVGRIRTIYPSYNIVKYVSLSNDNLRFGKMPSHQAVFIDSCSFKKLNYFNVLYSTSSDFELMTRALDLHLSIEHTNLIIANFPSGGVSSNKKNTYSEKYKVIYSHFGIFYGFYYKVRKMYIEQGIKSLLFALKLDKIYYYLAMIKNKLTHHNKAD